MVHIIVLALICGFIVNAILGYAIIMLFDLNCEWYCTIVNEIWPLLGRSIRMVHLFSYQHAHCFQRISVLFLFTLLYTGSY